MYFSKPLLYFSCLVVLLSLSCKDKLELNAPYKEIPSVYAILNPDDKIQMIRINKIFLGEGDANQMAQVADSVNYPSGELQVTLTDSKGTSINFHDSLITTSPGAFSTAQRVYVSGAKLKYKEPYTLKIRNLHTGNEFTARDTSLSPLNILGTYVPFVPVYYPAPPGTPVTSDNFIDYSVSNATYTIRYSPNEARLYQLVIRMNYYDSLGNGNKNFHYVDYPFGNLQLKNVAVSGPSKGFLVSDFLGKDLFNQTGLVLSGLPPVSGLIGRKMYMIEYFIYTSTQEYLDYLEYTKPSLNISQSKPIYSNFDKAAAIGIFTFKTSVNVKKNMSNQFISEFAYKSTTCPYQFFNASLSNTPGSGCK